MPTTTIRKALVSEFGDVSKINIVTAEMPEPPANHVQVQVIYSGFSGSDINMRLGVYPLQKKAPLTPGYCLVGTVKTNGEGCTKFQSGDIVACLSIYDAEAELANLPEKHLVPVPSGIDLQQATALVLDWNTAYGMVMRAARVTAGQRVFVHGLSGAVGHAVMVLCQLQGAKVYGTASERNHAALRALGATPFTYTDKAWIASIKSLGGVHAAFDPLGFESWDESYSVLRPAGGVLIGYGGNARTFAGGARRSVWLPVLKLLARNLAFWSHKRTVFYYISRDDKNFVPDLDALFALSSAGKIAVPIKRVFALEEIQLAHQSWSKQAGMGSFLIRLASEPARS